MGSSISIELRDLRTAVGLILDAVENQSGPTIDLDADYYWTVNPFAAFAPHDDAGEHLEMGQLSDDVGEIRRMVTCGEPPVIWHDLEHVVAALRRIATLG